MIVQLLAFFGLILSNTLVELIAVVTCTRYLIGRSSSLGKSYVRDAFSIGIMMMILLAAHIIQITIWAAVFMSVGEFEVFETSFYHSAVNFASLGYGDIVMNPPWRVLGALEAAVGILMFSVSGALLFAALNKILRVHFRTHTDNKS